MDLAPAGEPQTGNSTLAWERDLVAAVLRKDRKATAEFVDHLAGPVHAFVKWRLAPSGQAVDDIVQEVFLEAWRGLSRYRGDASLRAWILGIARHKVLDHYRSALRVADWDEPVQESLVEQPAADRELIHKERTERIQAVLAGLPESYRAVLLWRYWDSQSAASIGLAMGKTEKAVERLLARARAQFRAEYGA